MKIVQINATYGVGSTGHIVEDIHKHLLSEGHESIVFWATALKNSADNNEKIFRIGTTIDHKLHALFRRVFDNQGFNSWFATKSLCKKLKKICPDVVHLHNLHSNYINLKVLLRFLAKVQIPTVITLHDCWLFTGNCTHYVPYENCQEWQKGCENCKMYRKNVTKKLLRTKKELFLKIKKLAVIGVSQWICDEGKKSAVLSNSYIHKRIYNWVDYDLFYPTTSTNNIYEKYGLDKDKKIILGVSQGWSDKKGLQEIYMLSEAFKDIAQVVLVGGYDKDVDRSKINFLGYTSSIEELAKLYSAADVFANPSRMETFGKVTAEAMSCGTPVVAYNNTGTAELISEKTGILAEDGNKEEFVAAVGEILSKEKTEFSLACRQRVLEMFDKKKLLDEHITLYESVLK
ncbi:MAG: glycosyltransferase [Clostridia bacterium]|nr:glycosyltransferase [Clostridia bacterium]